MSTSQFSEIISIKLSITGWDWMEKQRSTQERIIKHQTDDTKGQYHQPCTSNSTKIEMFWPIINS